jgi:hypothetical protein
MKDCFLIKFATLYSLLFFHTFAVFAAVPKFVQIQLKDNFINQNVSTLNTNVNILQFEFDCFNTDIEVDEMRFKAFGDYLPFNFSFFELINLNNDDVLSLGTLSNGYVSFTENFECLSNSTLHVVVAAQLDHSMLNQDFSFGLKLLSSQGFDLNKPLLKYAEYPLNGDLINFEFVEPIIPPEEVLEDEPEEIVETEQDAEPAIDPLANMMAKMQEILDVQAQAQLDVNSFFVDSLGRIQEKTTDLELSISARDQQMDARIAELMNIIASQDQTVEVKDLLNFVKDKKIEGIDEQKLTSMVVNQVNKMLPKTQEVVLLNDSTLDVSRVEPNNMHEVLEMIAKLMQTQAEIQQQLNQAQKLELPAVGGVHFSDAVFDLDQNVKNVFHDIESDSQLSRSAFELYRRGVVNGYTNGFFIPNKTINRAEALKILLTLRYGEVGLLPVELNFSDVTEDDWFYKYIVMATHLEVVSGFEDGTFKPFMEITYPQFLKMMVGVFKLPVNMPSYLISAHSEKWYVDYLGIVDRYSLFEPVDFNEYGLLSRGKVVSILYNFLKNR